MKTVDETKKEVLQVEKEVEKIKRKYMMSSKRKQEELIKLNDLREYKEKTYQENVRRNIYLVRTFL